MTKGAAVIIVYAILLHFMWAIGLFVDPLTADVTAIATAAHWFPPPVVQMLFIVVASLATWGLITGHHKIIFLLPQQFVLFLSAGGAIHAMHCGCFADGVIRSHWFLINDQLPALLLAFFHAFSVLTMRDVKHAV